MKKRRVLFLAIFMSFLVGSCNYELDYPVLSDAEIAAEFGISEAQHYFEQHATDLSPLNFAYAVQTRAAHLTQLEFIPEWSKAVWSGHKAVSLIEVPILSNSTYGVKERHFKNGKQVYRKYHQIERRLVVARRNTGETDMFVITIVPSSTSDGNIAESMKNFRYLGGGDFTGKVFCSTLEGEFVKAFGYTDGKMNGTLTVMKRTQLKERAGENVMEEYSSFRIEEYIPDMASPYSFNEGGFSGGIIGGGGTGGNTGVTPGGSTKCPHGNNESSCPYCLEEVVVTACPYCHVQNGCRCPKCLYCGERERECRCTVCTRCKHKMPECTCYIYPDPDPDPIPGGSIGSGGEPTLQANGKATARKITDATEKAAKNALEKFGLSQPACNFGVQMAFNEIYSSKELDNKRANDIADYCNNSSKWEMVEMSKTQELANEGWFIIAAWKATTGSGHVTVIVPGETGKGNWNEIYTDLPNTMDTGANMKINSQLLNRSFGKSKHKDVKFYRYK